MKQTLIDNTKAGALAGLLAFLISLFVGETILSSTSIAAIAFGFVFLNGAGEDLLSANETAARIFYGGIILLLVVGMLWAYIANFSEMKMALRIVAPIGILLITGVVSTIFHASFKSTTEASEDE